MEDIELGSLLKKARQKKGLSLDDIQEETKIRKKYLEAIEANNFDLLPGKVYLKVFIKGYAREVDLDYQELLANYEILNIQEKKESNLQKDYLGGTKVSSRTRKKKKGSILKFIFIILLILFLGAAVVYTYQYISNAEIRLLNQSTSQEKNIEEESQVLEVNETEESDASEEESSDNTEPSEDPQSTNSSSDSNFNLDLSDDNDENQGFDLMDTFDSSLLNEGNTEIIEQNNFDGFEGLNSQEQDEITEIIVSDENNNQLSDINPAEAEIEQEANQNNQDAQNNQDNQDDQVQQEQQDEAALDNTITINASDTVWVTIDLDGDNVFSGILEAGEEESFELEGRLYMKIGNGSAITAEIGGENYGPWAGNGEIAEIEILEENQEISINNLRE